MEEKNSDLPHQLREREPLVILNDEIESNSGISLEFDLAYRDSLLIDTVKGIQVDPSGAVLIAGEAWERREIIRFDKDGNRLNTFGGYGTEEGEFLNINGLQLKGDSLFVYDGVSERITILNANSGETLRIIQTPAERYTDHRFGGEATAVPIHRFAGATR